MKSGGWLIVVRIAGALWFLFVIYTLLIAFFPGLAAAARACMPFGEGLGSGFRSSVGALWALAFALLYFLIGFFIWKMEAGMRMPVVWMSVMLLIFGGG